jgi:hypothetical protein
LIAISPLPPLVGSSNNLKGEIKMKAQKRILAELATQKQVLDKIYKSFAEFDESGRDSMGLDLQYQMATALRSIANKSSELAECLNRY